LKLENRRKLVQVLVEKSRKSLAAAASLSKEGFSEAAISRAYYAAFYLAQAALATKDISRSKHSGVIAALGEHLTRLRGFAGLKTGKWLKNRSLGLKGLHYRAVAEVAWGAPILGAGCGGNSSLSLSRSNWSSGSGWL
jgi:uncharacterized protein (UPF0332 family)